MECPIPPGFSSTAKKDPGLMLKTVVRQFALIVCSAAIAIPAAAQIPAPSPEGTPPPLLQIEREELRPGKGAAHAINEAAWAAAYGGPFTTRAACQFRTVALSSAKSLVCRRCLVPVPPESGRARARVDTERTRPDALTLSAALQHRPHNQPLNEPRAITT